MVSKKDNCVRKAAIALGIVVPLVYSSCKPDPVPGNAIDQSVVLQNDVELLYKATLNNVNTAVLNVSRDGKLILSETIDDVAKSGPDKQFVYRYSDNPDFIQGKFKFEIVGDNISKTSEVEIPDYAPGFNTNGVVFDFVENTSTKLSLGKPVEKNTNQNPLTLDKVITADGKTSVIYNTTSTGIDLDVKALSGAIGPYQLEFDFKTPTGDLEKTVLGGNIMKDVRKNFFVQPNDSTLNWYGSGDVDNNNVVNSQDLVMLNNILAGYTNPSDRRLMDRANVTGSGGPVSVSDRQLLEDFLNGVVSHLPGYWNKLNPEEKESWRAKMFAIDKTNENPYSSTYTCTIFTFQTIINFSGVSNPTDIARLKALYPFNFEDNGRFNIPTADMGLVKYALNGKPTGEGHDLIVIFMGNNADYNNLLKLEPQNDKTDIQIGQGYLSTFSDDSKLFIEGFPLKESSGGINPTNYITFDVANSSTTLTYVNPNLTTQRGSK